VFQSGTRCHAGVNNLVSAAMKKPQHRRKILEREMNQTVTEMNRGETN
jgi:hypothetical protein